MALHTIAEVKMHKGKRWVDHHKAEAKKIGHKNEHPTSHEVPVNNKTMPKLTTLLKMLLKQFKILKAKMINNQMKRICYFFYFNSVKWL